MSVRKPHESDLPGIARILNNIELFPAEMLEEMIAPFLADPAHLEQWFVYDDDKLGVTGFGFYRPEALTDGTWNLIAIGVLPTIQRRGVGGKMLEYVENKLSQERMLIIETSSLGTFAKTRRFYEQSGYALVAQIPDYWAAGDDKVIFAKTLAG